MFPLYTHYDGSMTAQSRLLHIVSLINKLEISGSRFVVTEVFFVDHAAGVGTEWLWRIVSTLSVIM